MDKTTAPPLITDDIRQVKGNTFREAEDSELREEQAQQELENLEDKETTYEDRLASVGIDREKALSIQHKLVEQGYYAEAYKLFDQYKVVFGTRKSSDTHRIADILETINPKTHLKFLDLMGRYNLAASLRIYREKEFNFRPTAEKGEEALFTERLEFVENLADPVANKLVEYLSHFDKKVMAALSDGAIENF